MKLRTIVYAPLFAVAALMSAGVPACDEPSNEHLNALSKAAMQAALCAARDACTRARSLENQLEREGKTIEASNTLAGLENKRESTLQGLTAMLAGSVDV